jgi:exodeoxyribonuclease III
MPPRPLRVVSWNVDGLTRTLPGPSSARRTHTLAELHRLLGEPDVLCLQEVRIRPGDRAEVEAMERGLPGFVCGHALSRDPVNARFRGGRTYGVATYVREQLAPRWLAAPDWDLEGRLVMCELPAHDLLIADVYAVNGTDKRYFEGGRVAGDRHGFKLRTQQRYLECFQAARLRGLGLMLVGDWNVSRSAIDIHPRLRLAPPHVAARRMLNEVLIPELDVVDVFRELHPELRKYTWFNRVAARHGRLDAARVDYALLSRSWLPRVSGADITQEQALALGSDHAPLWLELTPA